MNRALCWTAAASVLVHCLPAIVYLGLSTRPESTSCRRHSIKVNYILAEKQKSDIKTSKGSPATVKSKAPSQSPHIESSAHIAAEDYHEYSELSEPELLPESQITPSYTREARAMKIEGVVRFLVTINTAGTIESHELIDSLGYGLDEQALIALAHYRFKPAVDEQGRAHKSTAYCSFKFILES